MHDLFISYAHSDEASEWITALIAALEEEHATATGGSRLRIFFDRTDIRTMHDWEQRIREGLRSSRLMLACLSPAYFESKWCRREWDFYLEHERDHGLPGEGVAPIYFVTAPYLKKPPADEGLATWVAAIGKRQRLDLRPFYPEGPAALAREDIRMRLAALDQQIAERLDRAASAKQSPRTVPAHNRDFTGRAEELRQLRLTLQGGRVGVIAVVHGLGGVGKSALAFEYASAFASDYPGGRWLLPSENHADLWESLRLLGPMLGFEFTDEEKINTDLGLSRLSTEIERRDRMLLIFDNVDHSSLFDPALLCRLPEERLHLLATTRLAPHEIPLEKKSCLPVDELPHADALRLLEKYRPYAAETEREAADNIVRILGGFPLATEVIGVFLRAEPSVDYSGMLARLTTEGFAGIDSVASHDQVALSRHREKLLSTTLAPTLALLTEEERTALAFAAALDPDSIPIAWLKELIADDFPKAICPAKPGYPDPWTSVVRKLDGLRLLTPGQTPHLRRMHRLAQNYVSSQDTECGQRVKKIDSLVSKRAARFEVTWHDREARWEIESLKSWVGRVVGRLPSHIPTVDSKGLAPRIIQEGADSIEARKQMLTQCSIPGCSFGSRTGDAAANQVYFQSALVHLDEHPESVNLEIAQACSSLGRAEEELGHFSQALYLFRFAVELWKRCVAPLDPRLAVSYGDVASLSRSGNVREHQEALNRALELLEQTNDPNASCLVECYAKLALLNWEWVSQQDALELIDHCAKVYDRSKQRALHHALRFFLNTTIILLGIGKSDRARNLIDAVVKFGRDQNYVPWLALGWRCLAMIEKADGNLAPARELLLRAIEIQEAILDKDHFELGESYAVLAQIEQALGDASEARRRWTQASTIGMQVFFPAGPRKWMSWNRETAKLNKEAGYLAEARDNIWPIIHFFSGLTDNSDPQLLEDYVLLGSIEAQDGHVAEARACFNKAHVIAKRDLGPEHTRTHEIAQMAGATSTWRKFLRTLSRQS